MRPVVISCATSFPLHGEGPVERIDRWVLGVVAACIAVGLIASGFEETYGAFPLVAALVVFNVSRIAWAGSRHGDGTLTLTDEGLTAHTAGATHRYKWRNVNTAEVRQFQDSGTLAWIVTRLLRGEARKEIVVLKLKRSVRSPWTGSHFGTDAGGIPTLVIRSVVFYCGDSRGLAASVTSHVGATTSGAEFC